MSCYRIRVIEGRSAVVQMMKRTGDLQKERVSIMKDSFHVMEMGGTKGGDDLVNK